MTSINNIENSNHYQQVQQKTTTPSKQSNSFETLLSNRNNTSSGSFVLSILDEYNVISSLNLSARDQELFRNILSDDSVSYAEMNNLSYEQAVNFSKIMMYNGVDENDIKNMPIINSSNQVKDMVFATSLTNNSSINQTLYISAKNINNDMERKSLFNQVQNDLINEYGDDSSGNLWDINMTNINLNNFFMDMLSKHEEELEKTLINPDNLDERLKEKEKNVNQYKILLDTYNDLNINSSISFQKILENETREQFQNNKIDLGKFEKYVKTLNLSYETKKVFKTILEDDNVSLEEMDKLSYEEVEKLNKILYNASLDGVSMAWVTSGNQVFSMLSSTNLTNNSNFNKSVYSLMQKESDWMKRESLMMNIQSDINETYGNDLTTNATWSDKNLDIDYNDFINSMNIKYQGLLNKLLENQNVLDDAIEQYENRINQYKLLLEVYNNKTI